MKWSLMFDRKTWTAIILGVLALGIIVSKVLENNVTKRNNFTVSSIFSDRLQPSVDLYEMRVLNEQRLFILDEYLNAHSADDKQRLKDKMLGVCEKFDELLLKYRATLLVDEEQNVLDQLNKHLKGFDDALASMEFSESKLEAIQTAKSSVMLVNENLSKLNKLQSKIGKELLDGYKRDTYYNSFLNTFQILCFVLIGVVVLRVVLINKIDRKKN